MKFQISCLTALVVSVLWISTPNPAQAQATGDPIAGSAPIAPWSLVLEDVVAIPNSGGAPPRLEFLTGNSTTGLAYVIDQRGFVYSFDPLAIDPAAALFLDVAKNVGSLTTGREGGLRGMTFHPDFDNSGTPGYRKMYMGLNRTAESVPVGSPPPITFESPGDIDHYAVIAEWTLLFDGALAAVL